MATVIDLSSRKVVGWALADHMRTSLVEDALAIHHSQPTGGMINSRNLSAKADQAQRPRSRGSVGGTRGWRAPAGKRRG